MSLFKCGKCNKIFTRKLHIETHMSRKTNCIKSDQITIYSESNNSTLSETNQNVETNNIHKCKYCNKIYSRSDSLARHIQKNMCKVKRDLPFEIPLIKINETYPINNQLIDIIVDKSKAIEDLKSKYENNQNVNDLSLVKNKELSKLVLNDIVIIARPEDNFVNATELCRAGNKQFNDWYRLDKTKELIKELEKYENPKTGFPVSANYESYDLNNINIENIDTETNINIINSNSINVQKSDARIPVLENSQKSKTGIPVLENSQKSKTRIRVLENSNDSETKFIQSNKGGQDINNRATWIHPDLAIQLAQWISPKFALQVSKWIRTLFISGSISLENELRLKDEKIQLLQDSFMKKQKRTLFIS